MQETFPVKVFHFLPLQYSLVEGIMLLWFRSGKDRRLSEMPREPTPVWTMRQDVNLWGFYYAKCFTTVFLFIHAQSLTHWWKPTVSGKFGFGVLFKNGSHYQLHHLSLGAWSGHGDCVSFQHVSSKANELSLKKTCWRLDRLCVSGRTADPQQELTRASCQDIDQYQKLKVFSSVPTKRLYPFLNGNHESVCRH